LASPPGRVVLSLYVREQRFDSRSASDGIVLLELYLGRDAETELPRHTRAQMRCDAIEAVERCLLLALAAQHADVDTSVAQIGADFSPGHRHEADDSWILCRFGEERRDLDADRFGDAVRSTGVTQRRPPLR
jgi:hypothetical protein